MIDYRGKTVWITGASSGIGEALALAFAARGARLVLSARRAERLKALAERCAPAEVHVVPLDMSDVASLPRHAQEVTARVGAIDVMVHNAGVGQRSLAADTSVEVDRQMMETNYLGPVALSKALLPAMLARKAGTFVVMSSVLGVFGAPRRSGYAASKHALHGFFDSLRAELAGDDIRVLLVCPGRVRTEFSEAALEGDGSRHGKMDETSSKGLDAAQVAARTLRALDRGEHEVVVARWEKLPVLLKRASPALLRTALSRARTRMS
jgi:dehydrogenase/reductase SDR family protein 7B